MFISFFCIATEPFKNRYPIMQSLKSILPLADEIIVVLGREEESSENEMRALSDKIKIFKTNLWPEDWTYDVMTYHFDYALKKCQGDFCVKFDIDYIFKFNDIDDLREIFLNYGNHHRIYLPKINYLDIGHWMIYKKGVYCINRKLIEEDYGEDSYWIGNSNYVNELMVDGEIKDVVVDGEVKVFNYDCSFMDKETFYEKHFRWYHAYLKKWGNLDHFNLSKEELFDKEKMVSYVINRVKDRIKNAAANKNIYFDSFKYNPPVIRKKLREMTPEMYGSRYFGLMGLEEILYDKIPNDKKHLDKKISAIRKYYETVEGDYDFLKKENGKMIDILMKRYGKDIYISKFV